MRSAKSSSTLHIAISLRRTKRIYYTTQNSKRRNMQRRRRIYKMQTRCDTIKLSAKGRTRSTRVFSNAISVCADQSGRKIYARRHGSLSLFLCSTHTSCIYYIICALQNVNAILTYWPNQKEGNAGAKASPHPSLPLSRLHNNEITFQSDSNLFTTLNVFRRARLPCVVWY